MTEILLVYEYDKTGEKFFFLGWSGAWACWQPISPGEFIRKSKSAKGYKWIGFYVDGKIKRLVG